MELEKISEVAKYCKPRAAKIIMEYNSCIQCHEYPVTSYSNFTLCMYCLFKLPSRMIGNLFRGLHTDMKSYYVSIEYDGKLCDILAIPTQFNINGSVQAAINSEYHNIEDIDNHDNDLKCLQCSNIAEEMHIDHESDVGKFHVYCKKCKLGISYAYCHAFHFTTYHNLSYTRSVMVDIMALVKWSLGVICPVDVV